MIKLPEYLAAMVGNMRVTGQVPHALIGFVGPSGAGKTTACNHMIGKLGFNRLHVAQCVKEMLRAGFRLTSNEVETSERELPHPHLGGASARVVMEAVGMAVQSVAPWATSVQFAISVSQSGLRRVVVDGVRRQEEAAIIRALGGLVVRIIGETGYDGDDSKPLDVQQRSVKADACVLNDGDLDLLKRRVGFMAAPVLGAA